MLEQRRGSPECDRLLEHLHAHSGFHIAGPALHAAPCLPDYPYWSDMVSELKARTGQITASPPGSQS